MAKSPSVGPDLKDLKEGGAYPFGILIEAAGAKLDAGLEGVIERRIHGYLNYIEGFMHLNQRYDIWIRIGKKSFQKGLNSFERNRQSPLQTLQERTTNHRETTSYLHHRPSKTRRNDTRRNPSIRITRRKSQRPKRL